MEKTFTAVRTEEVDPFYIEAEEESSRRRSRRKGKKKNDYLKNRDGKAGRTNDSTSCKSHREKANQKVLQERSEDSVLTSIALHSRDMEDEANSFTKSVSSECRSVSSISVTSEMGDTEYVVDDDGQPDGLLTALSLESNPFVLRSLSDDSDNGHVKSSHSSSNVRISLPPGPPAPVSGQSSQDNNVGRSYSSGSSLGNVDLKPYSKEGEILAGVGSGLKTLISANMTTLHDPLLNPPTSEKEEDWPSALLLLIPLRLGLDKFNTAYIPVLKKFLRNRHSVGIIGGQVNRAIYFVGYRGDTLLGMDPHTVFHNPSLNVPFPSTEHLNQIHRSDLYELDFSLLDPSLALAFYFSDRYEFKAFCDETKFHQEQKTGELMMYNVQYAPASQTHVDLSYMCNSDDSDGEDDSDFEDEEYVFI